MPSLIIAGKLTPTNVALCEACDRIGVRSRLLPLETVAGRVASRDVVLGRVDVLPSLDGVEPGLDALRDLEGQGALILNRPYALMTAHDKLATARVLAAAGLPQPRTTHVDHGPRSDVDFDGPYVVKPRFGSWGEDVIRCDSRGRLRETLGELRGRSWFERGGALVQELIPNDGVDLRVVVASGVVVGAVNRVAAPGEWRTNVALGGRRRPVVPSSDACALAVAAAVVTGMDLAGVDLLPTQDGGYSILEVNACVDFTADYGFAGEDPFEAAIDALLYPAVLGLQEVSVVQDGPGSAVPRRGPVALANARKQGATRLAQFRCVECGYGISRPRAPERCPMCGGHRWNGGEPRGSRYGSSTVTATRGMQL